MEQIEGKSKFTKNAELLEEEHFTGLKSKWEEVDEDTKVTTKKIQTAMAFKRKAREEDEEITYRDGADRNTQRRTNDRGDRFDRGDGDRNGRGDRGGRGRGGRGRGRGGEDGQQFGRRDNGQGGEGRRGRPRDREMMNDDQD